MNNYFSPHTPLEIGLMVIVFIAFDVAGIGLLQLLGLEPPRFFRPVAWWLGLCQLSALMFISHFFGPFSGGLFIIGAAGTVLIYRKIFHHVAGRKSLLNTLRSSLPFFLLLLPLIPWAYIKTSLPPHAWDESVYHFVSPYRLVHEQTWDFHGLYKNLPRGLETIFVSLFALTSTYASARLVHLLIYLSTLWAIYLFLKSHFSHSTALNSVMGLIYFLPRLLGESTLGYIDMGTTSVIVISWLLLYEYFVRPTPKLFYLTLLVGSIGVGFKYNAIVPVLIVTVLLVAYSVLRQINLRLHPFQALGMALASLTLGGYWYIKNWITTGNPIYPFLFSCTSGSCSQGQEFFAWTTPIDLSHLSSIVSSLFGNRSWTPGVLGLFIFLSLIFPSKFRRPIIFFLLLIVIEALLTSTFAGFVLRYFYHWQLGLWLLFFLSLVSLSQTILQTFRVPRSLSVLILTTSLIVWGAKNLIWEYKTLLPHGASFHQTAYAIGKASLYDWLFWTVPKVSAAVIWCESSPNPLALTVKDPNLLWLTSDTKFPIFLTSCHHQEEFTPGAPRLLISSVDCEASLAENPLSSATKEAYRRQNQQLVCNSSKIVDGLYLVNP